MEAQHPDIRRHGVETCSSAHLRKPAANLVRVRQTDEGDAYSASLQHDSAWAVEDMQALVHRKQRIRHAAPFVISGNEQDRHARRRQALEWRECGFGQPGRHAASVQQVAAVDDDVDLAGARGLERALEILKEVIASPPPDDARAGGPVETEMRVGHEQDAHVTPTRAQRRGVRRPARVRRPIAVPREHRPQPDA